MKDQDQDEVFLSKMIKRTAIGGAVVLALCIGYGMRPVTQVDPGYVGVMTSFGHVNDEVYGSGLHFRVPVQQTMHQVYVGTNRVDEKLAAASNDKQIVTVDFVLNYHVTPAAAVRVFRDLGNDEVNRVIYPSMVEAAKSTVSQFDTNALVTQRDIVNAKIGDAVRAKLLPYGIAVDGTSLLNIDFSSQYNDAIEAAAAAQQKAIQAQNELKQTQWDAQKKVVQSEADVQVATNQAKANDILGKSMNDNPTVLEKLKIQTWDGHYPQYMMGAGVIPLIQVGK
jgi:prohibitin 2